MTFTDTLIPSVNTGKVRAWGNIWRAADSQQDPGTGVPDFISGAAAGYIPRYGTDFQRDGDIQYLHAEVSGSHILYWARETQPTAPIADTLAGELPHAEVMHHSIGWTSAWTDPGSAEQGSALFAGLVAGNLYLYVRSFNMKEVSATKVPNAWSNELGITNNAHMRIVWTPCGPVMFVRGPSSFRPGTDAIYAKYLWDNDPNEPAVEIKIDWQPSESLLVNFERWHVTCAPNGRVNFYYEVYNKPLDFQGTAIASYDIVEDRDIASTTQNPFTFSTSNVLLSPKLLSAEVVPIVALNGARCHPVTNQIVLGMYPTVNPTEEAQIHWYFSRGTGTKLDPTPLVWSPSTHPNLFSGRLLLACPGSSVTITQVGWVGHRDGAPFRVLGYNILGGVQPAYQDFANTYAPGTDNGATARRPLIGEIGVEGIKGEPNHGGRHQLLDIVGAPISASQLDISGYNAEIDQYGALLLLRMDEFDGDTVYAEIGPNASKADVAPGPGFVNGSQLFAQDSSIIEVGLDPSLDTTTFLMSFWASFDTGGDGSVVMKDGTTGRTFQVHWDGANTLTLFYTTVADGTRSFAYTAIVPGIRYHVTLAYNGTEATIFLNGSAMASDSPPTGGPLTTAATPIVFGDDSGTTYGTIGFSFTGEIDDFVYAAAPGYEQFDVLKAYANSLIYAPDGVPASPVRVSLGAGPEAQDTVLATSCTSLFGNASSRRVTLALRYLNACVDGALDTDAVIDCWSYSENGAPEYHGVLPLPAPTHQAGTPPPGGCTTPRMKARKVSFDPVIIDSFDTTNVWYVLPIFGDDNTFAVWAVKFDPTQPETVGEMDWSQALYMDLSSSPYPTAFTAFIRTGDTVPTVVVAVDDVSTAGNRGVYFVRPADYLNSSPVSGTAPYVPISTLTPITSSVGPNSPTPNVFGIDPSRDPVITGIVARDIVGGDGWHSDWVGSVQIIYSVGAVHNADGVDPTVDETVCMTMTYEVNGTSLDAGARPIVPLSGTGVSVTPKQLDQYLDHGIEPFVPVQLVTLRTRTSDLLLLGRRGPRNWFGWQDQDYSAQMQGSNGYEIYRLKREGSWSCKPVLPVPMTYQGHDQTRTGMSFTMLYDVNVERPEVLIARPYPTAQDKVSTTYLSAEEIAAGGWNMPAPGPISQVVRRHDDVPSIVWTRHRLDTKANPANPSSQAPNRGNREQSQVILRWAPDGDYSLGPMGGHGGDIGGGDLEVGEELG